MNQATLLRCGLAGLLTISMAAEVGATDLGFSSYFQVPGADPHFAGDIVPLYTSAGGWMLVYEDEDQGGTSVLYSTDAGVSWGSAVLLMNGSGRNSVSLQHDGSTTVLVATDRQDAAGSTYHSDTDLFYRRSADGGVNWSAEAPLNPDAATDNSSELQDYGPVAFAPDGAGNWIAAWTGTSAIDDGLGAHVFTLGSSDDGVTFSGEVDVYGAANIALGQRVSMAIGSGSKAILLTHARPGGTGDYEIIYLVSTDFGNSWSSGSVLNIDYASETDSDVSPDIATDGAGNWVTVWERDEAIVHSRSTDNGVTWSTPLPLVETGDSRSGEPRIQRFGTTWIITWRSDKSELGNFHAAYYSVSSDAGATWSTPAVALANTEASAPDQALDTTPLVASDGVGRYMAAWNDRADFVDADTEFIAVARVYQDCPSVPATCKGGVKSRSAAVDIQNRVDSSDKYKWKWSKGEATDKAADFGDPTDDTYQVLCWYGSSSEIPSLVLERDIPPGGICRGKPCWKENSKGYKYKDSRFDQGTIKKVLLKDGAAGKAKIVMQGHGETLEEATLLPFSQDSTVVQQLINLSTGTCWETVYRVEDTSENSAERFRARGQ